MVATTFAADTPLAITEFVRGQGIWKNWFWWNLLMGSLLSVFLFSRLWRRAEVLTDNELLEIRYSGKQLPFYVRSRLVIFPYFITLLLWVG